MLPKKMETLAKGSAEGSSVKKAAALRPLASAAKGSSSSNQETNLKSLVKKKVKSK